MKREQKPMFQRRAVTLAGVITAVFLLFGVRLCHLQIAEHEAWREQAQGGTTVTLSIAPSRGEILDRNMTPLAVNTAAYAVVVNYNYYPVGSGESARRQQNTLILELTALLSARGESWNDTLPISRDMPYTFAADREASVAALKRSLRLSEEADAAACMEALCRRFGLQEYAPHDRRIAAGVQYEMSERAFGAFTPYVFAAAVAKETTYRIAENGAAFPGVEIRATAVRGYVAGRTAAHLLGTVGPIYAEEYAALKEQGYALNDTLGKSGAESAFETLLRGRAGVRVLEKDTAGRVVQDYEQTPPTPGNTVVLTLDAVLQATAQQALGEAVAALRERPATSGGTFLNNGHDVKSGAVVVLDVTDGGVLAAASWPDYDLASYTAEYSALLADPDNPLFNRALNGVFACGSTMKPAVALAALNEGAITPETTVTCRHTYDRFAAGGLVLRCMGRHGKISVVTALEDSCNVFFYETGLGVGIGQMNRYAAWLGLGQRTGIEIGEARGVLAGPEHSAAVGKTWLAGDTAGAAIGQSDNLFTPIQLASYAMALANDGVRYKTHLLHRVITYDGAEVSRYTAEVAAAAPLSDVAIATVRAGMCAAATDGTAAAYFRRAPYTVACKTGTAQVGSGRSDHGVFIAYAPADSPQVALAVVMENGTSAAAQGVARRVLDAYFA